MPLSLLSAVICNPAVANLMDGKSTHEPARDLVALLVRYNQDIDWHIGLIRSALPRDYEGNTLREVPAMVRGALEKGFHQPKPARRSKPERAKRRSAADLALDSIRESGVHLFHDRANAAYGGFATPTGGTINVPLRSDEARLRLRGITYRATAKAITDKDLETIIGSLEAEALHGGSEPRAVWLRVGGSLDAFAHDLATPDGAVVEINPDGYAVTREPSIAMVRVAGMQPLPLPRQGSEPLSGIKKLEAFLRLPHGLFVVVLGFLLSALRPRGPYPCLIVRGEQGSGKSFLCEVIKRIVDPTTPNRTSLPQTVQNLMVVAAARYLLVFDNTSGLKGEISDALCSLATGAGFETRRLYSDGGVFSVDICRPFIANGIGDFVHRPDLLDRSFPMQLPTIPEGQRRSEAAMKAEFEALLPELLHDLYSACSIALKRLRDVTEPTSLRMSDAAHWLMAAEPGTGLKEGTFLDVLTEAQGQLMADLAMSDTLYLELTTELADHDAGRPLVTTAAELLGRFHKRMIRPDRYFPSTPASLGQRLRRLRPALAQAGVHVEFLERSKKQGRAIRLWLDRDTQAAARQRLNDHGDGPSI